MTDDEKLQMWQLGAVFNNIPDYLNDDAAAMSLLDTLVEKRYIWLLYGREKGSLCNIYKMPDVDAIATQKGNTRRAAVVAACLELIEKEGV